jgi:EAL domain-containing protein (putative c-di-GMP-specific phosphodiesterase class I)
MSVDGNDATIVAAIISMAASLKLGTVAEGIETREQASQLLALGCTVGQGYHFSKPVPADRTIELLQTMQTTHTARNRPLQIVSA